MGHISGFEYFMSKKRTQNFSVEIYFPDFDYTHIRSFKFWDSEITQKTTKRQIKSIKSIFMILMQVKNL